MCVCLCVFYTRSDQIVDAIIIVATQIAMKRAKHVSVSAHNRVSVYCKNIDFTYSLGLVTHMKLKRHFH